MHKQKLILHFYFTIDIPAGNPNDVHDMTYITKEYIKELGVVMTLGNDVGKKYNSFYFFLVHRGNTFYKSSVTAALPLSIVFAKDNKEAESTVTDNDSDNKKIKADHPLVEAKLFRLTIQTLESPGFMERIGISLVFRAGDLLCYT